MKTHLRSRFLVVFASRCAFCAIVLLLVVLTAANVTATVRGGGGEFKGASASPDQSPDEELEVVGHMGGEATAVVVRGEHAYVGFGPKLAVVDVSNRADPTQVGFAILRDQYVDVFAPIEAIAISETYAFVGTTANDSQAQGLHVVDISDPVSPTVVAAYNSLSAVYDIEIRGRYAYLAAPRKGLVVLDISDPAAPREAGVEETHAEYRGLALVEGDDSGELYAYVATASNAGEESGVPPTLRIFNVSDPTHPVQINALPLAQSLTGLTVAGKYAYVPVGYSGLQIFDVSEPETPVEVGRYAHSDVFDVTVVGARAYLATQDGLRVLDVSNPAILQEVGHYDILNAVTRVAVAGGDNPEALYAYLTVGADGDHPEREGLLVVDVSDPSAPVEVGALAAPGKVLRVDAEGQRAYTADHWLVRILDMSRVAATRQVGVYVPGGGQSVTGLTAIGNSLYVGEGQTLRVLDASDPTDPNEVDTLVTPGTVGGVARRGDYAYVADGRAGLRVLDASRPGALREVGSHDPVGLESSADISVVNGYAYVAGEWEGLQVLDVSNPQAPRSVFSTDWPADALVVSGTLAYVAGRHIAELGFTLRILDASNPAQPVELGSYDVRGADVADLEVSGHSVYYASSAGVLGVLDVSDPAHPRRLSHGTVIDVGDRAPMESLAVADGYAYAGGGNKVWIVDVLEPRQPAVVSSHELPLEWSVEEVAVVDPDGPGGQRYLYVGSDKLLVLDVSDPAHPREVGTHFFDGRVYDIKIAGRYAYLAQGPLAIVDISNPAFPVLAGKDDFGASWTTVAVAGEYAYLAGSGHALWVVHVGDPQRPVRVGAYDRRPGFATNVALSGDYAYVADGPAGLSIVDISNPVWPVEVGVFRAEGVWAGETLDVAVAGNRAYVADKYLGLVIVDISDPSAPVQVGQHPVTYQAMAVDYGGGRPYVAGEFDGVIGFDVSTPIDPRRAEHYNTPDNATDVAIEGGLIYVADDDGGLFVLRSTRRPEGHQLYLPVVRTSGR